MTHSALNDREFQRLMGDYCDRRLDDAASLAQLEAELRGCAARRAEFYAYHDLHAELRWAISATRRAAALTVPTELPPARWWRRAAVWARQPMPLSLLISGLFLTVVLLSFALWNLPTWTPTPATPLDRTAYVARLLRTVDAQWEDPSALEQGRVVDLQVGQHLELRAGLAEVLLDSGAMAVFEGPASFTLRGRNGVELHAGKLAARVPPRAVGFWVETPTVEVLDLGTEFGVRANGAETEVQVLAGSVEVRRRNQANALAHRLTAGQAALFGDSSSQGFYVQEKKMNRTTFLGMMALLASPGAHLADGAIIDVPNFSFEEPTTLNDGAHAAGSFFGWTFENVSGGSRNGGRVNPSGSMYINATDNSVSLGVPQGTADGRHIAYLQHGAAGVSTWTSTNSLATIEDNMTYTLTVAVGRRLDLASGNVSIALLADDVLIPGASATIDGALLTAGTFVDLTASFTTAVLGDALTGSTLKIQLMHESTVAERQANFDNVRLSASPAPEPASGALLGVGTAVALGLVRFMRRRRTSAAE